MHPIFSRWLKRHFSDPQAVALLVILFIGFGVVLWFGNILAPLLIAIVLAYLLDWLVLRLGQLRIPRLLAVSLVTFGCLTLVLVGLVVVLPLVGNQLRSLFEQELPSMLTQGRQALMLLPERYPELVSADQVGKAVEMVRDKLAEFGQLLISASLSSLISLGKLLVYLVLVPLLVFFILKDRDLLLRWLVHTMPEERLLATRVWQEMNQQIGNYVRGKILEIFIVGAVTFLTFTLLDLRYSLLLSILIGLSVLIPYIGAAVATIPVGVIAYFQFGWGADFGYVMLAYAIIQALDGNVLVPILFSEAVNLHPVAIIVAVLLFGGFWGFWGVFFAIPLATLVKAVWNVWPTPTSMGDSGAAET